MFDLQNFPLALKILAHAPDCSGGEALREILWSLWNQKRYCNLWESIGDLGREERAELVQLFLMPAEERERVLRALLEESGEMERIDERETRTMLRLEERRAAL
jgi:hypothetical protein